MRHQCVGNGVGGRTPHQTLVRDPPSCIGASQVQTKVEMYMDVEGIHDISLAGRRLVYGHYIVVSMAFQQRLIQILQLVQQEILQLVQTPKSCWTQIGLGYGHTFTHESNFVTMVIHITMSNNYMVFKYVYELRQI